jgi:predicted RNA-binding protein YlxR (DUF448 family)
MMKKKNIRTAAVKHIPQRTCVACGEVRPQREMVRLVRVSGGRVEVDPVGRKAGRGAYLCPQPDCWQAGLKKGRLEYVLRTRLTDDNREQLAGYGKGLDKE